MKFSGLGFAFVNMAMMLSILCFYEYCLIATIISWMQLYSKNYSDFKTMTPLAGCCLLSYLITK